MSEEIYVHLIQIIGIVLIWAAVNYDRGSKRELKWFTKSWFIIFGLLSIGLHLITNAYEWFN